MPTWGEILNELRATRAPNGGPDNDLVRRKYLGQLHDYTGRATILYATAFLESRPIPPAEVQITLIDIQGFMEAISNLEERELDLLLLSPGGSAEAAESIVNYLRSKFEHVRVIVPMAAMSAATMMALSADEIVLARHSQLGPIDPQFSILTPEGPRSAPAKAILDQFEKAKLECRDPSNLAAWMPILRSYAPGLLAQCEDQRELAERMVIAWLERYMFKGDHSASKEAQAVARWFADYSNFQSHGRPIGLDQAPPDLKLSRLESDQKLQDLVLSVHHATMHTFTNTPAAKIIENHKGRAWVRIHGEVLVESPAPGRLTPSTPSQPANRSERRKLQRGR